MNKKNGMKIEIKKKELVKNKYYEVVQLAILKKDWKKINKHWYFWCPAGIPRRWKGKIVTSTSLIEIKNLNEKKRPISAVADNFEVRNIKKVIIKINNSINFKLLYDKNNNLNKKIKLEQFKNKNFI